MRISKATLPIWSCPVALAQAIVLFHTAVNLSASTINFFIQEE